MSEIDLPLRSPALYNPHLLSKQELIGLFSARQRLLDRLLADLRSTGPGQGAQHHLLVGQRGMGKTMLLRRLQFAVEDDAELAAAWLPLSFPEEQYNIAGLADFWLNCLDALSDHLERLGQGAEVSALDEEVEALRVGPEEQRARRALAELTAAAGKLGRRLLLLVDNADLIFDRIGEQDWVLREALSAEPALTFLGASAAVVESTYRYDKAFYDFFQVHELGGLDYEETRALLLRYAEAQGNPEVARLAEEEPGRLKTLHTLTGGNPRTLVLLYNVFARGNAGDVRSDLEQLLDQVTPLYKARFEALAPQAQRVVHALAVRWDPASAGELAEGLGLEVNAVSSQLARLVKHGVVEKVPYEPATKTGFQVAERFFNIWYLMRASRRVRRRLIWLVEFLRMFSGRDELRRHARLYLGRLCGPESDERLRHAEYSFALAEAFGEGPMRGALESAGLRTLMGSEELRRQIGELVDLEGADAGLKDRAEFLERFEALRSKLAARVKEVREPGGEATLEGMLLRAPIRLAEKEAIVERLPELTVEEIEKVSGVLAAGEAALRDLLVSPELVEALFQAMQSGYMIAFDDIEGAESAEAALGVTGLTAVTAAQQLERSGDEEALARLEETLNDAPTPYPWLAWLEHSTNAEVTERTELAIDRARTLGAQSAAVLNRLGIVLGFKLGRHKEAMLVILNATEVDPQDFGAWNNLGTLLIGEQDREEEAEVAYRKALGAKPSFAGAWYNLGNLLSEQGRNEEAEDAYRKALAAEPSLAWAWVSLGNLLSEQSRNEEAEVAYRKALEAEPESALAWSNLGNLLREQSRNEEAEVAYRKTLEVDPKYASIWKNLGYLLIEQGRMEEAEDACRKALATEPRNTGVMNTLAYLLYIQDRDPSEAERLAREARSDTQERPEVSHTLACILTRLGKWPQAVGVAKTFLRAWTPEPPEDLWPDILTFFRETVVRGHAREAAELLDEMELGERWRPLREALEAAARENPDYLRRVAPEVRRPAEEILGQLTG